MPRQPPGPVATIGELEASNPFFIAHCNGRMPGGGPCMHTQRIPWAAMREKFGADASSDKVRQNLRCSVCGNLGGMTMHPGSSDDPRGNWRGGEADTGASPGLPSRPRSPSKG